MIIALQYVSVKQELSKFKFNGASKSKNGKKSSGSRDTGDQNSDASLVVEQEEEILTDVDDDRLISNEGLPPPSSLATSSTLSQNSST